MLVDTLRPPSEGDAFDLGIPMNLIAWKAYIGPETALIAYRTGSIEGNLPSCSLCRSRNTACN